MTSSHRTPIPCHGFSQLAIALDRRSARRLGPIGDAVREIAPHTEADPGAILVQSLVMFGNLVGRAPHLKVNGARHGTNENAVIVGATAGARKGTSRGRAEEIIGGAMTSGVLLV